MTNGYPVATVPEPRDPNLPAIEKQALTPAEQESVDLLYEELKPMATASARDYVLARTPAQFQEAMMAKIDADWPVPPPPPEDELASRRRDGLAYLRPADPPAGGFFAPPNADPNFNPNLPPAVDPYPPVRQ